MTEILLLQLPVDILINILKNLQYKDVFNLMLTCKFLKNLIIKENSIWRSICNTNSILVIQKTVKHSKSNMSWYNRCRISHNWCKGIYKNMVLINHYVKYMPWITLHPEALFMSIGSELYCHALDKCGFPMKDNIYWYLSMPEIDRFDIRTNDISRFMLKGNLLACGNRNGSTAVYRLDNIKTKPHLIQYIRDSYENGNVEVSAVEIYNGKENAYMVTASNNSPYVLFWKWDTRNESSNLCHYTYDAENYMAIDLHDHKGAKCLAINNHGDKLAIGLNGNSKPVMIDVNTTEFMLSFTDSKYINQAVRDVQWHNENTLCYVTHSGRVQLIDVRSHKLIYDVLDPFNSSLYCVKTDGQNAIIAGTSEYSRCVLFDSRFPRHTQLYFTQRKPSPVYSLDFDSTKLIAAVDLGVGALNFNVSATTVKQRDNSHIFS